MRIPSITALVASTLCAAGQASADEFEIEAEAAVVSDYRWRGVSLSDEQPSLQVEATASHRSGVWFWGNVNTVESAYGGAEIGLGAGYTHAFGPWEWTLGAVQYLYPGEEDLDYTEFDLSLATSVGALAVSAGIEYVPDQRNYADDDVYSWIGWDISAPHNLTLHGHVGHDDGVMASTPYAIDYSIGVSAPLGPLNLDFSLVQVENEDAAGVVRLAYTMAAD